MKKLTKKQQKEKALEDLALGYALNEVFSSFKNADATYRALQKNVFIASDSVYELYDTWEPSDILKVVSTSMASLCEFYSYAKELGL